MRILVANKFWYRRGGLERVMFDEVSWLQALGHEVADFSTTHPANERSEWSRYHVPYLELGQDGGLGTREKIQAVARIFWNRDAARRLGQLIADFRPDVIHVHGIHRQISSSILFVARRHRIPVVQTLHDYHHICPADTLLYGCAEVCEPRRCRRHYTSAVSAKCVRGSVGASTISAIETSWQRLLRAYENGVARFISPSVFMAEQMKAGGWSVPVDIVPNAVAADAPRSSAGSGFVVAGRLAREKGVAVALSAAKEAGVDVTVAGEGPLGETLRGEYPHVPFTGRLSGDGIANLIRGSRAVLVPSLWYENAPMSVLEAMAAGVPVIASRLGGIPEQVTDGVNGLLVAPGDARALATAMRRLEDDPAYAMSLGQNARATVVARFSPDRHIEGVLASYRAAGAP